MKVEMPVRWKSIDLTQEEIDAFKAVNGDDSELPESYEYSELVFDIDDVRTFNRLDDEHTTVNILDIHYHIAIPYNQFKKIYVDLTGKAIFEVKVKHGSNSAEVNTKVKRKPKQKDDENNFEKDNDLFE
jgi:hypothetical protein